MGDRYRTGGLGTGKPPGDTMPEAFRALERRVRNLEARTGLGSSTDFSPLSTPYIGAGGIVRSSEFATPPDIVTSATFTDVSHIGLYNQHPNVSVHARVICDASTTGEARLSGNSGLVLSSVVSIGSGATFSGFIVMDAAELGDWLDYELLTLQIRRVSGAGNVRGMAVAVFGTDVTAGVYP